MEVIKKNAKPIIIAAGAAAVTIAGLYLIFKKASKKVRITETQTLEDLTEKEKDTIIKEIKVTYNGKLLSVDSTVAITLALSKFTAAVRRNLTNENLRLRRANRNDLIRYAQLCKESIINMQNVAGPAAKELLDRLGVSQEVCVKSCEYYLQQGHPKMVNIEVDIVHAQDSKPLRQISKEEVRKTMVRVTEISKAELVNVGVLNAELRDPYLTAIVITYRVADAIYEELGIDLEDFNTALKKFLPEFGAEDQRIFQEFTKEKRKLDQIAQGNPYY